MKAYCPTCEEDTDQRSIEKTVEIQIRGESIPVHVKYQQCENVVKIMKLSNQIMTHYTKHISYIDPEKICFTLKKLKNFEGN